MSAQFRKLIPIFVIVLSLTSIAKPQSKDQTSERLIAKLDCPDRVKDVAFSPDGKLLAAGYGWNNQGGARIWNVADRKTVATLTVGKGDSANIERVAFSPNGKLFAAANWDGDVLLWAVGEWASHQKIIAHRGSPKFLIFSPTGAKLAFSSEEVALLYDLRSGKAITLGVQKTARDSLVSVSFTADERSVTIFREDAIEVRDVESGRLIRSWKPHGAGFFGLTSSDGQYVIAGGGAVYGEKTIEIWNAKDGKKVNEVSGFRSGLFALAISHSSKLFAVAGGEYGSGGDLSLWDLKEAQEIGFVSFGEMPIEGLAFSPDDKVLAAGSNDGFVLLYAVDRLRGPELKKQNTSLCGEIKVEGNKVFIVPLTKVPMDRGFEYAWKLEVANPNSLAEFAGEPVVLHDWSIESNAARDKAKVGELQQLLPREHSSSAISNYAVFGDIQNPGWNEGFIVKIYGDGSFVASNNPGRCLAYGSLSGFNMPRDFDSLRKQLLSEGLLSIPKEPLTRALAHFRTRFIELSVNGVSELRSDAEAVDLSKSINSLTKKEENFSRIFGQEELFINLLLHAGLRAPNTQRHSLH